MPDTYSFNHKYLIKQTYTCLNDPTYYSYFYGDLQCAVDLYNLGSSVNWFSFREDKITPTIPNDILKRNPKAFIDFTYCQRAAERAEKVLRGAIHNVFNKPGSITSMIITLEGDVVWTHQINFS